MPGIRDVKIGLASMIKELRPGPKRAARVRSSQTHHVLTFTASKPKNYEILMPPVDLANWKQTRFEFTIAEVENTKK